MTTRIRSTETTPSSQPYFQATKKGAPAVATACPPRRLHHNHRRYRDAIPRWSTDRNIPHHSPPPPRFCKLPDAKKKKKNDNNIVAFTAILPCFFLDLPFRPVSTSSRVEHPRLSFSVFVLLCGLSPARAARRKSLVFKLLFYRTHSSAVRIH